MKAIILIICIFFSNISTYSQAQVHSAGPAPVIENFKPQVQDLNRQIGTRTFTQVSASPSFQFGKSVLENCAITNIGAPFLMTFSGGLMNRNGVIYTWNQSPPHQLWSIDTLTGIHTLLFNMTGVPYSNFTGMCWDGTIVYGLSTNLIASQIFTINMTTGVCTLIGIPQTACAGGITLLGRPGAQYSLFVLDIVGDNLYKFHKYIGTAALVGPLGVDINFGQDGNVDPNDGTFYAAVYTTSSELRKVDTTTGALGTAHCTYTGQVTGLACIKNAGFPWPAATYCRGGLNIPIPDHSTVRDSVEGFFGSGICVLDVNVRIDSVIHTWDADLSFYLQKGSVGVKIINKVGGSGDNFINTVLNDSAATPIASGTAPFSGSYIPSSPLTSFINQQADGFWKLVITDSATGDTGILSKWCVAITYYPANCFQGGIQTTEIPNYYFLNQNYPNPFNPATVIKFGVPGSGDVKLVIYDILGREVSTLMNEHKHPGTYEVNFDASYLSSGVYFYSIQTDNFRETKRMLLVK